jgi:hypothetical protein
MLRPILRAVVVVSGLALGLAGDLHVTPVRAALQPQPELSQIQDEATRYYEFTKFHARGNVKAFELAKKNIALHTDRKPTISSGRLDERRIVEVALRDDDPKNPAEHALLSGWLLFPYACEDPRDEYFTKVPVKERYLDGFHLFLKSRGFKPDLTRIAGGLTSSEALQLDCLIVLSCLKWYRSINDTEQLDPFERARLQEAVDGLSKRLGSGQPDDLVAHFKKLFEGKGTPGDWKLFQQTCEALGRVKADGKPGVLAEAFERWLDLPKQAAREDDGKYILRCADVIGDRLLTLKELDPNARTAFLECVQMTLGLKNRPVPLSTLSGLLHRPGSHDDLAALRDAFLSKVNEDLPLALPSRPVRPGASGQLESLVPPIPIKEEPLPRETGRKRATEPAGEDSKRDEEPTELKRLREAEQQWHRERLVYFALIGLLALGGLVVFFARRRWTAGPR